MYSQDRKAGCTDFVLAGQVVTSETSTAYSLIWAGFHNVNGLKTSQNAHIRDLCGATCCLWSGSHATKP